MFDDVAIEKILEFCDVRSRAMMTLVCREFRDWINRQPNKWVLELCESHLEKAICVFRRDLMYENYIPRGGVSRLFIDKPSPSFGYAKTTINGYTVQCTWGETMVNDYHCCMFLYRPRLTIETHDNPKFELRACDTFTLCEYFRETMVFCSLLTFGRCVKSIYVSNYPAVGRVWKDLYFGFCSTYNDFSSVAVLQVGIVRSNTDEIEQDYLKRTKKGKELSIIFNNNRNNATTKKTKKRKISTLY